MESSPQSAGSTWDRRLDIVVAILLSVAAVITSWSGYQSSLWDSEESVFFARAGGAHRDSVVAADEENFERNVDINMFMAWLNARELGQHKLEAFYRTRFRAGFKPVFESWLAGDPEHNPEALPHPFAQQSYKLALYQKSKEMKQKAAALVEAAEKADDNSDYYVLNTVIMALAMFFSGILRQFPDRRIQVALLVMASGATLLGIMHVLEYPIAHPGERE